jgi:magnesium chelatase subunit I
MGMNLPKTLGELKKSGYRVISVKQEMRANLVKMLKAGEKLFPGIVGYDDTVIPGMVNAILSRHDIILLGLRGQAKSRILRALPAFLDEYVPVVPGSPINDHPLAPITEKARRLVAEQGDKLQIEWLHREERYHEKLATPDVTIADLIGDIDPIKAAAKKLDYSDEEVIHYGIIPRTNRGIFAINELPDLAPRIQVGLLNIMEEKELQIRGFPVRLPMDIVMVYSANPEDYTNRGSIITPLKDRIDSQIMTHYPQNVETAIRITEQEAWIARDAGPELSMPGYYKELVELVSFAARESEFVDQKSGVSARVSISLMENVLSNMERRALAHKERRVHPRISDLNTALTAITGKVELVYEGEQEGPSIIARKLIGEAVKKLFRKYFPPPEDPKKTKKRARKGDEEESEEEPERQEKAPNTVYAPVLAWFSDGKKVEMTDTLPHPEYLRSLQQVDELERIARKYMPSQDEGDVAMGMELVLEGLHQHSMLSKNEDDKRTMYQDMLSAMFAHMADQ